MGSPNEPTGSWQYNGDSGYYEPAPAPAPAVDAGAVVEQMYQEVLGRAPDAGGYQAFVDAINSGADIGALAASMANSQEAQNRGITQQAQAVANNIAADTGAYVEQVVAKQYNADFVNNLYYGVLGRAPDAAGLQNNLNLLNSGQISPDQLAASFAASKEAQTNNIASGQEQQAAQQVLGTYGQTGQNKVDVASGNWSGVSAADLARAGITNPAILSAAATGTLNDNIFGSYKTDANVIANALNTGSKIPAQQVQQLNTASSITGTPSGKVVAGQAIGNGQTVYYYSNGGSVTVDAKGVPVSISLGKEAYRQASTSGDAASLAVADNPGTAMFNGRVVTVSAPHLQWNPSTNSIQDTAQGIPMAYREPTSGGIGADLAKFDKQVGETIPGGWSTIAAVALAVATYGASAGLTEGAMMAADASGLAASGISEAQIAQIIGQSYSISAEAAAAVAGAAAEATAVAVAGGTVPGISAAEIAAVQQGTADAILATGTGGQVAGTGTGIVTATGTGAAGAGYTGVIGPGVAQTLTGSMGYGALSSAGMNALTQLASGKNIDLSQVLTAAATGAITGGIANQVLDPALTLTKALQNGAITGITGSVVNSLVTGQPLTIQSLALGAALGATINGIANQYTLPDGSIRQLFADGSTSTINPTTGTVALTDPTMDPNMFAAVDDHGVTRYFNPTNSSLYNADGTIDARATVAFNNPMMGDAYSPVAGPGTGSVTVSGGPAELNALSNSQLEDMVQMIKNGTSYSDALSIARGIEVTGVGVDPSKIGTGVPTEGLPTGPNQVNTSGGLIPVTGITLYDPVNPNNPKLLPLTNTPPPPPQTVQQPPSTANGPVSPGATDANVTGPVAPNAPGAAGGGGGNTGGGGMPGTGGTGLQPGTGQIGTTGSGGTGGGVGTGAGVGSGAGTGVGTGTGTGVGSGAGPGAGPGNGLGSGGGTGGGLGSGGGGGGGLGSGGGGLGSGGGGMGSGGGAGFGGLVPNTNKPATTATQTTIYPKSNLPNLSGGLVNPGLNPGWMNQGVQPMYATTSPVQSEFYWGGHPYMPDYASLQNYNRVPAAPATPWGIQQMSAPLTSYLPAGYAAGPVAPPVMPLQQSAYVAPQAPIMPQPTYGIPKV